MRLRPYAAPLSILSIHMMAEIYRAAGAAAAAVSYVGTAVGVITYRYLVQHNTLLLYVPLGRVGHRSPLRVRPVIS